MKEELPSIHYTCKAATAAERLPVYSWRVTYAGEKRMNMEQLASVHLPAFHRRSSCIPHTQEACTVNTHTHIHMVRFMYTGRHNN